MFGLGAFVVATVAQEFFRGTRARRAMTGESAGGALLALVARNRRRYGGYIVHAGVAVALVGVAASTSFQHQRTATLLPGQSARVAGYDVKYVRPTASATAQKISFGAVLAVSKGGHRVTTLTTSYGLYPSLDPMHPIGRFFNGSSESRVGLDAGVLRDLWVVIAPNVTPLQGLISTGDVKIAKALLSVQSLPAGPAGLAAQHDLPAARHPHQRAGPAVRQPSVEDPVPHGGLAAGDLAVAGGHHRRVRRPHRAVAGAAAVAAGALSVRRRGAAAPPTSPPAHAPEPVRERELV